MFAKHFRTMVVWILDRPPNIRSPPSQNHPTNLVRSMTVDCTPHANGTTKVVIGAVHSCRPVSGGVEFGLVLYGQSEGFFMTVVSVRFFCLELMAQVYTHEETVEV